MRHRAQEGIGQELGEKRGTGQWKSWSMWSLYTLWPPRLRRRREQEGNKATLGLSVWASLVTPCACHRCRHRMVATRHLAALTVPDRAATTCRHGNETRVNDGGLSGHANMINGSDAERYLGIARCVDNSSFSPRPPRFQPE
jgi:hypothetical protein